MTSYTLIDFVTTYSMICFCWGVLSYGASGAFRIKISPLRKLYDAFVLAPVITFLEPVRGFLRARKRINFLLRKFHNRRSMQSVTDLLERQRVVAFRQGASRGREVESKAQLPLD